MYLLKRFVLSVLQALFVKPNKIRDPWLERVSCNNFCSWITILVESAFKRNTSF